MSFKQNIAFFLLYDYLPETGFIMYYVDSLKRGYEEPREIRDNHYFNRQQRRSLTTRKFWYNKTKGGRK